MYRHTAPVLLRALIGTFQDEKREAEEQQKGSKRSKTVQNADSDADAELSGPLPPTERQRQALSASLAVPEHTTAEDDIFEEDFVENETDRDFIDDDGAEPAEDAPYYSDGEQGQPDYTTNPSMQ